MELQKEINGLGVKISKLEAELNEAKELQHRLLQQKFHQDTGLVIGDSVACSTTSARYVFIGLNTYGTALFKAQFSDRTLSSEIKELLTWRRV